MALNSRETIESVKFAVGLWLDACDEGGLAWDDTNNNRASWDADPVLLPFRDIPRLGRRQMGLRRDCQGVCVRSRLDPARLPVVEQIVCL